MHRHAVASALRSPPVPAPMRCSTCMERFEPGKSSCYCGELDRRRAYDAQRERRGLAPLYRPPSMR